tara:strand:- start:677 stop:901 length:225 start_codon:yes stop_codon:yes gene_type:complete
MGLASIRWMMLHREISMRSFSSKGSSKLCAYIVGRSAPNVRTLAKILRDLNRVEPLSDQEKVDLINDILNIRDE